MVNREGTRALAYIVSNFPCYSETFVLNELVELKRRGYRLILFSLKRPEERIVQTEARPFLNDTFYSPFWLDLGLWWAQAYFLMTRPLAYVGLLWDIVRACAMKPVALVKNMAIFPKSVSFAYRIRSQGVRHLHAHFANFPTTSALIVSRLLKIPFSFTCHAHDIFYDRAMLDVKVESSRTCRAISKYNRDFIKSVCRAIPYGKLVVVHCGLYPEKFAADSAAGRSGPVRILSVGRLAPPKGFDDTIRACGILREKGIDFLCDIVGEGPMEGELKDLVKRMGLGAKIRFTGPLSQEEVAALCRRADIFILASKRAHHRDVQDGIPVVLMEAMASGSPVVSTTVSGIPELVEDGSSGLLARPGDFRMLAEKVASLIGDPALRERCRANGRTKIEGDFNIKKIVDALEKIFDG